MLPTVAPARSCLRRPAGGSRQAGAARLDASDQAAHRQRRAAGAAKLVLIALPAIPRDDPDWHAAVVLAHILGGGQQSRLFSEVREKRGLAYSVSSALRSQRKASLLVVATGSAGEKVANSLRVIKSELVRLREGVTDQELAEAKTYLSGSLALLLDSSGSVANLLHTLQVDRQPRDYLDRRAALIGAVKAEDVRRVARRILREEAMTTVVVGRPAGTTSTAEP